MFQTTKIFVEANEPSKNQKPSQIFKSSAKQKKGEPIGAFSLPGPSKKSFEYFPQMAHNYWKSPFLMGKSTINDYFQ